MKQSEIREKIISAVYTANFLTDSGIVFEYADVLEDSFEEEYENISSFAKSLYVKSLINQDEAIKNIQTNLTKWSFNRLNRVIQAILITAYTERNVINETDKKVIINEYIELSKKYGDANDYRLVNSVLDKVLN